MESRSRRKLDLARETVWLLTARQIAQADGGVVNRSGECWTERMPCTERTLLGCSDGCYTFNNC